MKLHFVFVGEGSSDEGLVPHLEKLCITAGADEATGVAPDLRRLPNQVGHSVFEKMQAALRLEPTADLIFVHRDADCRDPEPRYQEIAEAARALNCESRFVCIVPIQEIEAWLLLDEEAIRSVAGRRYAKGDLKLFKPNEIERITHPKEQLKDVLLKASELTGRKLQRFKMDFAVHRRLLLQRLPVGEYLDQVPAWKRLCEDLKGIVRHLRSIE